MSLFSPIQTVTIIPQKGAGFHLDLFWIALLLIPTSFMALPWYVSTTVISLAHIESLKMETAKSAPGVEPTFMGVRYVEQYSEDLI